jgi:hypothetical protein
MPALERIGVCPAGPLISILRRGWPCRRRQPARLIRNLARLARPTDDGSRPNLLSDPDHVLLPSTRRLLADLHCDAASEPTTNDETAAYRTTPVRGRGIVRFPIESGRSHLAQRLLEGPSSAVTASMFRYYARTDLCRCLEARAPLIARVRLVEIAHDMPIDHVMLPRFDGEQLVSVRGWFCFPSPSGAVDLDWSEILSVFHDRRARILRLPSRLLWPRDQSARFFGIMVALNSRWRWDSDAA